MIKLDQSSGSADCSAHRRCKQRSGRIERPRLGVRSWILGISWKSENGAGYPDSV